MAASSATRPARARTLSRPASSSLPSPGATRSGRVYAAEKRRRFRPRRAVKARAQPRHKAFRPPPKGYPGGMFERFRNRSDSRDDYADDGGGVATTTRGDVDGDGVADGTGRTAVADRTATGAPTTRET